MHAQRPPNRLSLCQPVAGEGIHAAPCLRPIKVGVRMIVRRALLALALVVTLGTTACGDGDRKPPAAAAPTAQAASPSPSTPPEPFTFAVGPAAGTKNLPISAEVETRVTGGKVASVTL